MDRHLRPLTASSRFDSSQGDSTYDGTRQAGQCVNEPALRWCRNAQDFRAWRTSSGVSASSRSPRNSSTLRASASPCSCSRAIQGSARQPSGGRSSGVRKSGRFSSCPAGRRRRRRSSVSRRSPTCSTRCPRGLSAPSSSRSAVLLTSRSYAPIPATPSPIRARSRLPCGRSSPSLRLKLPFCSPSMMCSGLTRPPPRRWGLPFGGYEGSA